MSHGVDLIRPCPGPGGQVVAVERHDQREPQAAHRAFDIEQAIAVMVVNQPDAVPDRQCHQRSRHQPALGERRWRLRVKGRQTDHRTMGERQAVLRPLP